MFKNIIKIIGVNFALIFILSACTTATDVVTSVDKTNKPEVVTPDDVTKQKTIAAQKEIAQADPQLAELMKKAAQIAKAAQLITDVSQNNNQVVLTLKIKNSEQKEIVSARTWLTYNSEQLEVAELDVISSDFDLAAPNESQAEPELGLIKIGLSKTGDPLSKAEIEVAKIVFNKKTEGLSIIDFYNYQEDQSGFVQVNAQTSVEKHPVNILEKPQSPAVIIQ